MTELLAQFLPKRLLHASRRRAALAALRRPRRRPAFVLFVCHGNLFRSPFAAAVLQRVLRRGGARHIQVDSAGLLGPGRRVSPTAVAAAARRGVDLAAHSSQLVLADMVRAADVVVVMDAAQRRTVSERFGRAPEDVLLLGDFDPAPAPTRGIEDPVEQGPEVCDRVYARIERCVGELAKALGDGAR
jgi:protein-tyrosine-phosphatase